MHQQVERTPRLNKGIGRMTADAILWVAVTTLSSVACGGSDNKGGSSGGATAVGGGNQGQGGTVAGAVTTGNGGATINTGGSANVGGGGGSGGGQTTTSGGNAATGGSSQTTSIGGTSTVSTGATATGGKVAGGGTGTGGKAAGGASTGGVNTGGAATGGKTAGGTGTGGAATGGAATGGSATGGKAAGGTGTGGKATGGASTGGASAGGTTSTSPVGTSCQDAPAMVVPSGYTLVWSDEFNVDGRPDSANWGYESGMVRNNEAQYYQQDNATVSNGCLIIEARKENVGGASYTSSSLRTMGKQSWQYGRFEMRARFKTETGLWPAWWMLGNSGSWPACGEIDIMEYYGGQVRANIACERNGSAHWDGAGWDVSGFVDKNWQNEFHAWRMDWDDQKIDLYLDDKLVNTANLADMLNSDGSSPFKQKAYMLVNLALGGNNGGSLTNTTLPSHYEVDYIRVFQKQ